MQSKLQLLKRFTTSAAFLAMLSVLPMQAGAVSILIGDVDGFGFSPTTGLQAANGSAADTNGNGLLESGEYLPDLNGDHAVAYNTGDNFDNRSAAEASATNGAQYTDVALSRNYSGSPALADDAQFTFTFAVPTSGDPDYGVDHFINFIFGDYDVTPMTATVDGTTITFVKQAAGDDGLIQYAYANVAWADMMDGEVVIDIIAPNEPYVAFDYALLDTRNIADIIGVPAPATLLLFMVGLLPLTRELRCRKRVA